MRERCYIYCIAPADVELASPVFGGVRAVRHRALQALMSTDVPSWVDVADPSPADVEVLAQRHHAVSQALLALCTPIPLRLGTVFENDRRLRDFLERAETPLMQTLASLQGRREWGLKLRVDRGLAQHLVRNAELQALDERIASASEGARYLLRKQRERLVAQTCETWLVGKTHRLAHLVDQHAEGWVEGFHSAVWSAAALVHESREASFAEAAAAYNRSLAGQAELSVTGPWAPYSFVPPLEMQAA